MRAQRVIREFKAEKRSVKTQFGMINLAELYQVD